MNKKNKNFKKRFYQFVIQIVHFHTLIFNILIKKIQYDLRTFEINQNS